jgi:hypothetical protein
MVETEGWFDTASFGPMNCGGITSRRLATSMKKQGLLRILVSS